MQQNQGKQDHSPPQPPSETMLEQEIIHALHTRAHHVQCSPELRTQVMQRISRKPAFQPRLVPVFALLAMLIISTTLIISLASPHLPSRSGQAAITYVQDTSIAVPPELANGGQLLSLDPTGHHLLYQPAQQPGVMYIADLANPTQTSSLAMRYALDASWAPDGSALVATVLPTGSTKPLLALVPTGKYMFPLGHEALAASWSPNASTITFVTQSNSHTHIQETQPTKDHPATIRATMNGTLPVHSMAWSPDGKQLLLVLADTTSTTTNQQGRSIYIMNATTNTLTALVQQGDYTIGKVTWAPNHHYLAYEQITKDGHYILHAIDTDTQRSLFTLPLQHALQGWSWSPDSNDIAYSDGGTLYVKQLQGNPVTLAHIEGQQVSPFWLPDGRILFVHIQHGVEELVLMKKSTR